MFVDGVLKERDVDYTIDFVTGTITFFVPPPLNSLVEVYYSTTVIGRWKWGVVGRDSKAADANGLSILTSYIASLGLTIGASGQEMDNPLTLGIPALLYSFGGGTDRLNYYDSIW